MYRVSIAHTINIHFLDKQKAKAFFIDGSWKTCFGNFDDLEALSGFLAHEFLNSKCPSRKRHIEGFGEFVFVRERNIWRLNDEHIKADGNTLPCGDIEIRYSPADITTEVEEHDDN